MLKAEISESKVRSLKNVTSPAGAIKFEELYRHFSNPKEVLQYSTAVCSIGAVKFSLAESRVLFLSHRLLEHLLQRKGGGRLLPGAFLLLVLESDNVTESKQSTEAVVLLQLRGEADLPKFRFFDEEKVNFAAHGLLLDPTLQKLNHFQLLGFEASIAATLVFRGQKLELKRLPPRAIPFDAWIVSAEAEEAHSLLWVFVNFDSLDQKPIKSQSGEATVVFHRKEDTISLGQVKPTEYSSIPAVEVYFKLEDFVGSADSYEGQRIGIFGQTRSGKSNAAKVLLHQVIQKELEKESEVPLKVFIFDVNGEYSDKKEANESRQVRGKKRKGLCFEEKVRQLKPEAVQRMDLGFDYFEYPSTALAYLEELIFSTETGSAAAFDSLRGIREILNREAEDEPAEDEKMKARLLFSAFCFQALSEVGRSPKIQAPSWYKEYVSKLEPKKRVEVAKVGDSLVKVSLERPNSDSDESWSKSFENALREIQTEIGKRLESKDPRSIDFDGIFLSKGKFYGSSRASFGNYLEKFTQLFKSGEAPFSERVEDFLKKFSTGVCILDLSQSLSDVVRYVTTRVAQKVFSYQERHSLSSGRERRRILFLFEEAHNYFPKDGSVTNVFARLAKEGAKLSLGMVYVTQSPSLIHYDILNQTSTFLVGYLGSKREIQTLIDTRPEIEALSNLMKYRSPDDRGWMVVMKRDHFFPIPVKVKDFEEV